ncbi:PREDICTED: uncharacterized protein LOC108360822 [Rhagoletis zephyria]|uniref:uncharacterized protein LOC108360822 n=1 Tax=Rhagoletis zephyria TaxID=28612 RepID=UPI00081147DE|nr:PREDICTED: uncharacterized protein LOC108360822 [Rhagoletis zephyria]
MKISKGITRDASNPLELDEAMFIKNYRLNKASFTYVLGELEEGSAINQITRLASVLRFLSEGSYQHGVRKDFDAPMAQSTFSGILKSTLAVLQARLYPHWVNLNMTDAETQKASLHGTHIKIVSPKEDKFLFYNRKGIFSIQCHDYL